ncbi:hypothetical protein AVEN_251708-1 [Araneus ventricosus]|uniref:Uncharacterized protein n=1 Tax=Araneus ventricosus TaxID=182803 RepID=A0A4Y2B681_ARAVE|nr:hypothetical protein AVEN_251708-1 [Araneus ventricosus]
MAQKTSKYLSRNCIPWYNKYCGSSNDEEEDEYSSSSLLSSEENTYEKVPGKDGIDGYQACSGYTEVPSYQGVPSYQAGPSYQGVSGFLATPSSAEGSYHPGLACFRPIANYEGVFAHRQIPIYQQDLVEPQLPPYSHAYKQHITVPQYDILVY